MPSFNMTLKARTFTNSSTTIQAPPATPPKQRRRKRGSTAASQVNKIIGVVCLAILISSVLASSLGLYFSISANRVARVSDTSDSTSLAEMSTKLRASTNSAAQLNSSPITLSSDDAHRHLMKQVRSDFVQMYGSLDWVDKAMQPFGNITVTAQRLLAAASSQQKTFVMAFAGYSVTVGRGNYFRQSFPFVLERLLKPLFKQVFHIELIVRNAAIGGIPSFPYAFCLPHFLGTDADVMSWDYSMNEGNGAAVLESYLRLSQTSMPKQPMMIVLDKNRDRKELLQAYARLGFLHDGVVLSRATDVLPKQLIENSEERDKPPGFQHWNDFGAPDGCPGKSSWHPKKAEHEFLGYVLAMHMINVMERALELKESRTSTAVTASTIFPYPRFYKPLQKPPDNPKAVTQLLYGHDDGLGSYHLQDLSCRTSFLPAQDYEKVLPSVVVSGFVPSSAENIMQERSDSMYNQGWVLDVSKIERDTKKKVERCGGLGYIDMKIALYGIPQSGTLKLWLPYEGHNNANVVGNMASQWFDDLVLCEANEKRDDDACRLDRDLQIRVGGVAVQSSSMMNGAGVYLNRQTCLHIEIPAGAIISKYSDLTHFDGSPLSLEDRKRLQPVDDNQIGLVVELQTDSTVTRSKGACCISHVVWEQH